MNHRITPLTEGGLLAALTVIMALIAVYVPVLGAVAALLWPLPIIVLIVRHGMRWGVMAVLVAAALMAMLIEPTLSLRLVIGFGPVGLMLGYGYHRQWPAVRLFLATLFAAVLAQLAMLAVLFAITGINPLNLQVDALRESIQGSLDLYRDMHMDEAQIAQTEQQLNQGLSLLMLLMPVVVLLMGLCDAFINFLIAGRVLRRLGHPVAVFPPFAEWHLPRAFVYLFGFALVGMYWGGTRDVGPLYQAALNANMLATLAGLLQGLALLHFFAQYKHLSKLLRGVILAFVLLNGMMTQILAFVGLFDMIFDYRRRFRQRSDHDVK